MPLKRIISRLDIKGPNLVKGINLEGLRVLGNPDFFSKHYYEDGADEVIYHDCVASLYEKKYLLEFINKTSSNVFIPLSVGGGIKTLKDIELILKNGADKVFINSAAIKKPRFLDVAVKNFGSSTISISIEANKKNNGEYYCFYDYGRETSVKKVKNWTEEVQSRGVGEIILTSIARDGTGEG
ncbi:MAG: imidazole glycerol phosphate synthase cyclase subunit, partial [Rickettsiales bacterium]|nr:imidazole glycerol phosphate synthase cyclase subunit [Rickettsiales bacterium]